MFDHSWGTIADAAVMRDVSTRTIRRYIDAGLIEAVRFGPRLIRVNLQSLDNANSPVEKGSAA